MSLGPTVWSLHTPAGLMVATVACTVAVLLSATQRIELRGGGQISLGATIVSAVPALLPARSGVPAIGLLFLSVALLSRFGPAARRPSQLVAGELPALAAVLAATLVGGISARAAAVGLDREGSVLVTVLAGSVLTSAVDLVLRSRGWLGRARADHTEVALVHTCLGCASTLLAVSTLRAGLAAGLLALVPLLLLTATYAARTTARRIGEETQDALAVLSEVVGHAPPGHGPRLLVWADALADERRLGWQDREALRVAARLHHLGETVDTGTVLGPLGLEEHQLDVLNRASQPARRSEDDLLPALARVTCTFDTAAWGEDGGIGAGVLAVRSAHRVGAEADAAATLLRVLDRRQHLLPVLLPPSGGPQGPGGAQGERPPVTPGRHAE